ncbi:MAG: 30S ribosomal protein S6 [Mariprofundaceae bacterium]
MYYETIFIVNPDVSQENTDQLTDELIAKVEKAGGRIVKREYWGSRALAYSIAKRKRGHYVLLVTDGEPQAAAVLENAIRLDERILRFLTTKLTELSDEPSPLVRRKASTSTDEATSSEEKPAEAETAAEDKPAEAASSEEKPAAEEKPVKTEAATTEAPATDAAKAEETPAA